jgi:hypothetical protein
MFKFSYAKRHPIATQAEAVREHAWLNLWNVSQGINRTLTSPQA